MKHTLFLIFILTFLFSCSKKNDYLSGDANVNENICIDSLFTGGIYVKIADKDSTNIRIYTDTILSEMRIKAIVSDLMKDYSNIYFGTTDHHLIGEEYSSWVGDRYFDYINSRIISKRTFFKVVENSTTTVGKEKKQSNKRRKPKLRKNLDAPI